METSKVVLVTGSSTGFGRLTALTLARQGYRVFAGIRNTGTKNLAASTELAELALTEKLNLEVLDLDVTSEASVEQAVSRIIELAGRLDVIVNNAGLAALGPLEAYTASQIQQLFETNVFGILRLNRAAIPHLRRQGSGLLIQVSSVLGRTAFPFVGLYAATKYAVEALTEAYQLELAGLGIEAVVVEPAAYATNIMSNGILSADGERLPLYADYMNRVVNFVATSSQEGNPQEVADAISGVIATQEGQRPLRVVVAPAGQREGTEAINSVTEQVSQATVTALGLEGYTKFSSQTGQLVAQTN